MPISLLHRLAHEQLPVDIVDAEEIDRLRVLVLGGHVKASIPEPSRSLDGWSQGKAQALDITPNGRRMLRTFRAS